jgi:hypothetical protein
MVGWIEMITGLIGRISIALLKYSSEIYTV